MMPVRRGRHTVPHPGLPARLSSYWPAQATPTLQHQGSSTGEFVVSQEGESKLVQDMREAVIILSEGH